MQSMRDKHEICQTAKVFFDLSAYNFGTCCKYVIIILALFVI